MNSEKIYYDSTDGIKLCGLMSKVNNTKKIVILCHGIRSNKDEANGFVELVKAFENENINSFRFDFRGHGQSSGEDLDVTVLNEVKDLEATIKMLQEKSFTDFIIMGASFGAGTACLLNFSKYNIKGLICWYGALDYHVISDDSFFSKENQKVAEENGYYYSTSKRTGKVFRLSKKLFEEVNQYIPYHNIVNLDLPILFVHGYKDSMVPYTLSEQVSKLCKNSKLVLIENGEHSFRNQDKELKEAIQHTIEFIQEDCI